MLRDTARGGASTNPMMSYITDAAPQQGEATMRAGRHAEVPHALPCSLHLLSNAGWCDCLVIYAFPSMLRNQLQICGMGRLVWTDPLRCRTI